MMTAQSPAISHQDLIEILRVGLKAVSPYNAQPWGFQFKDDRLFIYARHNYRGFWKLIETIYSTLGAFLENLSEGAKHLHYAMTYVLLDNPDVNLSKPVCAVDFRKMEISTAYEITHVMARYTNRKIYNSRPVPPSVLKLIGDLFRGPTRAVLDITGQRTLIEQCALLEKVRIMNTQLRDEIYTNLTYRREDTEKYRRGLDIRTLELPLYARLYMLLNRNHFFRGTIGKSIFPQFFAQNSCKKILGGTPLLLAFQESELSNENIIRDWMDIQRILNTLHREGLNSHIHSSSIDLLKIKKTFYNPTELDILNNAESNIQKSLGIDITSIITLLRVGYAEACPIQSLRRDPEDLFWDKTV